MIRYDPGRWGIFFAFSFTGSVFQRALCIAIPSSALSLVMHEVLYCRMGQRIDSSDRLVLAVQSGFSYILGILVVLRSHQAHARWWEGVSLMHQIRGEWFNSFSSLIAFSNYTNERFDAVRQFQHQVIRLFSLLYGCALQQVSSELGRSFEMMSIEGINIESIDYLQDVPDKLEVVLQWIQRLVVECSDDGVLNIPPPVLAKVFGDLSKGNVLLNNARKLTDFQCPFPLAQAITIMMLMYSIVAPFVFALELDTHLKAAAVTLITMIAYWSINCICIELESPFGDNLNDLPLNDMAKDMNDSLCALMDHRAQHVPSFNFNADQHLRLTMSECCLDQNFMISNVATVRMKRPLPTSRYQVESESVEKSSSHAPICSHKNAHRSTEDRVLPTSVSQDVVDCEGIDVSVVPGTLVSTPTSVPMRSETIPAANTGLSGSVACQTHEPKGRMHAPVIQAPGCLRNFAPEAQREIHNKNVAPMKVRPDRHAHPESCSRDSSKSPPQLPVESLERSGEYMDSVYVRACGTRQLEDKALVPSQACPVVDYPAISNSNIYEEKNKCVAVVPIVPSFDFDARKASTNSTITSPAEFPGLRRAMTTPIPRHPADVRECPPAAEKTSCLSYPDGLNCKRRPSPTTLGHPIRENVTPPHKDLFDPCSRGIATGELHTGTPAASATRLECPGDEGDCSVMAAVGLDFGQRHLETDKLCDLSPPVLY